MTKRPYAFITGASSGIGAAFARLAARKGCDVGVTARREERLNALAGELRAEHGVAADVFPADLSAPGAARQLIDAVRAAGRLPDILINNAGATVAKGFARTTFSEQEAFLDLTLMAPVALAHAFLPGMIAKGRGRIINIASITALSSGGKGHTLYPAAKSFLLKFSQSLNAEVAEKGVFVSAVLPGFVATEFQQANGMAEKMKGEHERFAQTAEEVAAESWSRNDKGVEIIVPGGPPKIAAACLRYLPEPLVRALTRPAAAKYYVGD